MKLLIVALALVAAVSAFNEDDIPAHMKDRLDRYIVLKNEWKLKWHSMTDSERGHYEQVLLGRLDQLPQIYHQRMHDRIQSMPEEHRMKMRDYLRRRFPQEDREEFTNEVDEIDSIIKSLPDAIREKLQDLILVKFQEATAYSIDDEAETIEDELNFPDIPEIIEIPQAVGYSIDIPEGLRVRLDEFLLKREDWKSKWERLSEEKRNVFERYINERLD